MARTRCANEPSVTAPPRAVWASRIAEASSAMVGMKRSMSEKTIASSCPGRPTRESGDRHDSNASVSWVGVVVSRMSAPMRMAMVKRSG